MNYIIEIIKTIITAILNNMIPVKKSNIEIPKLKNNKKSAISENIKLSANGFSYFDDAIYKANHYSNRIVDKSIAVIHFSWTKTLDSLSSYFSKYAKTNSTWGVGKDGTVHRYLPTSETPSWTQGLHSYDKGGFINHKGRWVKNVNNISCSFEVVNINYEDYTELQYQAVSIRLLWMLKYYPNFRLWYTTGHEQITPIKKHDPGHKWDWKKLFVTCCGVHPDFYKEYLSYLAETSSYSTVGDAQRSERKLVEIKLGVNKLITLKDKDKDYCF